MINIYSNLPRALEFPAPDIVPFWAFTVISVFSNLSRYSGLKFSFLFNFSDHLRFQELRHLLVFPDGRAGRVVL